MDILIHASLKRMWYLTNFLLPKMPIRKLKIYYDRGYGNIEAYLRSYNTLPNSGDTWHLEDDVLPDRRFFKWAEEYEDFGGIVCGFYTTEEENMYSFPCIRIPNYYIKDFLEWVKVTDDQCVKDRMKLGKGIDFIFNRYWLTHKIPMIKHDPCMVEHIDDLIGGSLLNIREKPLKALRFEDDEAIENLKRRLRNGEKATGGSNNP